jgi:hypothetical protein
MRTLLESARALPELAVMPAMPAALLSTLQVRLEVRRVAKGSMGPVAARAGWMP